MNSTLSGGGSNRNKVIHQFISSLFASDMNETEKIFYSRLALTKLNGTHITDIPTLNKGDNIHNDTDVHEYIKNSLIDLPENTNDPLNFITAVYRKYRIRVKEGKWNYLGVVDFFGSNDSGIDPVQFWSDDGEVPSRHQAIRIYADNWVDVSNSKVTIYRYHWHDGLRIWEYKACMFSGILQNGKGSGVGYDIHEVTRI